MENGKRKEKNKKRGGKRMRRMERDKEGENK